MVPCRRNAVSISSKWVVQMQDSWINHKFISDAKCARSLFAISDTHQFCSLGINLHHRQGVCQNNFKSDSRSIFSLQIALHV